MSSEPQRTKILLKTAKVCKCEKLRLEQAGVSRLWNVVNCTSKCDVRCGTDDCGSSQLAEEFVSNAPETEKSKLASDPSISIETIEAADRKHGKYSNSLSSHPSDETPSTASNRRELEQEVVIFETEEHNKTLDPEESLSVDEGYESLKAEELNLEESENHNTEAVLNPRSENSKISVKVAAEIVNVVEHLTTENVREKSVERSLQSESHINEQIESSKVANQNVNRGKFFRN